MTQAETDAFLAEFERRVKVIASPDYQADLERRVYEATKPDREWHADVLARSRELADHTVLR